MREGFWWFVIACRARLGSGEPVVGPRRGNGERSEGIEDVGDYEDIDKPGGSAIDDPAAVVGFYEALDSGSRSELDTWGPI